MKPYEKVVVFDDEEDVRYSIVYLVNNTHGYSVVGEASDGSEGIDLCLNLSPDIVVTDIRMPGYNGLELLAQLKERLPNVEVILISGYEWFQYAKKALELGAVSYLVKPVEECDLLAALNHASQRIEKRNKSKKSIENMKLTIEKLQSTLAADWGQTTDDAQQATQYPADIQKVIEHVRTNYMHDISLNYAAKIVYMNPSYFSDKFKKTTGKSFNNYVNDLRQEVALRLLRCSNLKIREVANLIGYSDVSYY